MSCLLAAWCITHSMHGLHHHQAMDTWLVARCQVAPGTDAFKGSE
jgi:hypothetical protein